MWTDSIKSLHLSMYAYILPCWISCTKYNYAIYYVMVNLIEIKNNGKCTNKSLKIVHENSYSRNFIISL